MRKIVKSILLLLLLFGAYALPAQNADGSRYKLAVYATVTGIQDDQTVKSIKTIAQGTASNALIGSGRYEMIERSSEFMKQIEAEQQYQMSGDVRDDQISQIGASYGAQKICVVGVTISGSYLYVAARIVDVVTKTSTESGEADDDDYIGVAKIRPTVLEAIKTIIGVSDTKPTANRTSPNTNNGSNKEFEVNNATFKMVFVKGGSMYLGCTSGSGSCGSDESPSHNVTLTDYYMGETEVTQALWKAVMGYNNNPSSCKGDQLPVETVSWTDCQEFVARLNSLLASKLPQGYRFALPSEAQWEYAARGGQKSSGSMYAGSGNVGFVAWYYGNSSSHTHDVKQKAPNELGLYDMSGNVWEWCEDWYSSTFYSDNRNWTDPVNTYVGSNRVLRGGSWHDYAEYFRVATRNYDSPGGRAGSIGFRLALVRR